MNKSTEEKLTRPAKDSYGDGDVKDQ
jgi:hypothetical protein